MTVMTVMVVMEGMQNAVGSSLDTAAEGVVVTVVVVVAHFARRAVDYCTRLVNLERSGRVFLTRGDGIGVELAGRRASSRRRRRSNTLGRRLESTIVRGGELLGRERPRVRDVGLGRRRGLVYSVCRSRSSRGSRRGMGALAIVTFRDIELMFKGLIGRGFGAVFISQWRRLGRISTAIKTNKTQHRLGPDWPADRFTDARD